MADANKDYQRNIEYNAGYTSELKFKMGQMFPLLDTDASRDSFLNGEVAHVRIKIPQDRERNLILRQQLTTLLQAALDPNHPAYSEHGSEKHTTYEESINSVMNNVREGTFTLSLQPIRKTIGPRKNIQVTASRVILQPSQAIERTSYIPRPSEVATDLRDKDPKFREKELRRLTRQYGTSFGILVSLYSEPTYENVFKFFENDNFRNELQKAGFKVPSARRPGDSTMIAKMCEILTLKQANSLIPSPNPDKYKALLQILKDNKYIDNSPDNKAYGFHEVSEIVLPKVVFVGTDEKAQDLAPVELQDPFRTVYIMDQYGSGLTSIVATAYLEKL